MSRTYTHIRPPTQRLGRATAYTVYLAVASAFAAMVAHVAQYPHAARLFVNGLLILLVVAFLLTIVQECLDDFRKKDEPVPLSREDKRYIVQEVRKAHEGDANMPQMRGIGLAAPKPGKAKRAPASQVVIGHPIRKHTD